MRHKKTYKPGRLDDCQTPGYALLPILPYIRKFSNIWEPAAGEYLLATELASHVNTVIATDIKQGQDFFDYEPYFDAIVTNPPFSLKFKWIERCYQLGKPWALLLPVETIGAGKAQKMFDKYGMDVIFSSPRIDFKMPYKGWNTNGAQFPTAWFTWKMGAPPVSYYFFSLTKKQRQAYEQ